MSLVVKVKSFINVESAEPSCSAMNLCQALILAKSNPPHSSRALIMPPGKTERHQVKILVIKTRKNQKYVVHLYKI